MGVATIGQFGGFKELNARSSRVPCAELAACLDNDAPLFDHEEYGDFLLGCKGSLVQSRRPDQLVKHLRVRTST
jgi:hypothetical protein